MLMSRGEASCTALFQFQDTLSGPVPTPVKSVPPTFMTACILCSLFQWLVSFQTCHLFLEFLRKREGKKPRSYHWNFFASSELQSFLHLHLSHRSWCCFLEHWGTLQSVPVCTCHWLFPSQGKGKSDSAQPVHRTQQEAVLGHCQAIGDPKSKHKTVIRDGESRI